MHLLREHFPGAVNNLGDRARSLLLNRLAKHELARLGIPDPG
jgi:hypothetical protein